MVTRILSILFLTSLLAHAQFLTGRSGAFQAASAAAGGPDTYYYASTSTPAGAGSIGANWFQGNNITCTSGGSITKIGAYLRPNTGTGRTVRISVWKNTGSWVLHECGDIAIPDSGGSFAWIDFTLIAPLTVSDGQEVRIMYNASDNTVSFGYDGTTGGYWASRVFADGCSSTAPSWTDDYNVAVRAYVD
jgi:hypothetical protein